MPDSNTNSDKVIDVGQEQLARIYARAFLGAIEKTGNAARLVEELDSLVADVLDRFPEFEQTLMSHSLKHDEREKIILAVFGGRASEQVVNLLKVLSKNDRMELLRLVAKLVHRLYGESQGRYEVKVFTAHELGRELQAELRQVLQAKLGIEPEFVFRIHPDLIGGMVIQVGDTVYDGSVQTTLERTRQQMFVKTIDAIETRPERFISDVETQNTAV